MEIKAFLFLLDTPFISPFIWRRSRSQMLYIINVFKKLPKLIGKHFYWSLFLIELQALAFSCKFCEFFKKTFYRTLPGDCFCYESKNFINCKIRFSLTSGFKIFLTVVGVSVVGVGCICVGVTFSWPKKVYENYRVRLQWKVRRDTINFYSSCFINQIMKLL